MHTSTIRALAAASLFVAGLAFAGASQKHRTDAPSMAKRALAGDAAAIAGLRASGQAGVDAIFAAGGTSNPAVADQVCGQFDCATSRLFWHTDLDQAKRVAAAQGRPILSLRLLGRLDEELSCANSRFFRATLYPNAEVNEILRDTYVLHWETVREVPKVTIDFGDGRKLERTLTGNSIHYVLDSRGRPVDGIPGLHGAKAFASLLTRSGTLATKTAALDGDARRAALRDFHGKRLDAIATEWKKDLSKIGAAPEIRKNATTSERLAAFDKASDDHWDEIAARHTDDAQLDAASRRAASPLMPPDADTAGRLAATKMAVERPMLRQFDVLERSLQLDGVQNEYRLHPRLHLWFQEGSVPDDASRLNERVYDEIFLMPLSDPWLGLSPKNAFSGITADGRRIGVAPARPR